MSSSDADLLFSYLLADCCVSLTHRKFAKDLDQVVARARASGVQRMVCRATNEDNAKEALRLCHLFPETLFCTAGVAPLDSHRWTEDSANQLKSCLDGNQECVAVGEIGLDFSRDSVDKTTQLDVFQACLSVASVTRSPALVVIKDAHSDATRLLRPFADQREIPYFLIHDFHPENEEQVKELLALSDNLYFGLSGQLFKEESTRALLQDHVLPSNRLCKITKINAFLNIIANSVLESDSPWSFPNMRSARLTDTCRGTLSDRSQSFVNRYCTFQRNEPCSLPVTCELVAALSGQTAHEVALQTTFNALKVFSIN